MGWQAIMNKILIYNNWDDLDQVEKDVIQAIDDVTIYAEDIEKGFIRVKIEYVGSTWNESFQELINEM